MVICISHNDHVDICIMVMKILHNSRVNNQSWHMSGLCHVNFAECSCRFAKRSCGFYRMVIYILHNGHVDICIMVMKILQNSHVNNWSWHMSGSIVM